MELWGEDIGLRGVVLGMQLGFVKWGGGGGGGFKIIGGDESFGMQDIKVRVYM